MDAQTLQDNRQFLLRSTHNRSTSKRAHYFQMSRDEIIVKIEKLKERVTQTGEKGKKELSIRTRENSMARRRRRKKSYNKSNAY